LDTTAAIILNTESPRVVSSPAKAYPQKNIDELLFEIISSDARSRRIVNRMRDNAIDRGFVTVQADPANFSGAAR